MKKQLNAENAAKLAEKARSAYKTTINELEETSDPIESKKAEGERVTKLEKGDAVFRESSPEGSERYRARLICAEWRLTRQYWSLISILITRCFRE